MADPQQHSMTVRLPPELANKLAQLAAVQGASPEETLVWELRRALAGVSLGAPAGGSGELGPAQLGRTPSGRVHCGSTLLRQESARLYNTAPVLSLIEGVLTGEATVGQALARGDFGLGTLNLMDGELVILDGEVTQLDCNGGCNTVGSAAKTPYISVCKWMPERATTLHIECRMGWHDLKKSLLNSFPSPNIFYAIRVEGEFASVRVRAVRKQDRDKPLSEVTKDQVVFDLGGGPGTLVGFWSPEFEGFRLAVVGFHLHFVSSDKKRGGHVLSAEVLSGKAMVMPVRHTETDLPEAPGHVLGTSLLGATEEEQQAARQRADAMQAAEDGE